jgi:hypothetical protein
MNGPLRHGFGSRLAVRVTLRETIIKLSGYTSTRGFTPRVLAAPEQIKTQLEEKLA